SFGAGERGDECDIDWATQAQKQRIVGLCCKAQCCCSLRRDGEPQGAVSEGVETFYECRRRSLHCGHQRTRALRADVDRSATPQLGNGAFGGEKSRVAVDVCMRAHNRMTPCRSV